MFKFKFFNGHNGNIFIQFFRFKILFALRALSRISSVSMRSMVVYAFQTKDNFAVIALVRVDWNIFANQAFKVG